VTATDDENEFDAAPRTQMLSGEDIELLDDPKDIDGDAEPVEALDEADALAEPDFEPQKPPTVPPRPPAEPPPAPTVLELAVEEAKKQDWRAIADGLRAELDAEGDKARAALLAYELGEITERRLRE
jgi:hypothetical protein